MPVDSRPTLARPRAAGHSPDLTPSGPAKARPWLACQRVSHKPAPAEGPRCSPTSAEQHRAAVAVLLSYGHAQHLGRPLVLQPARDRPPHNGRSHDLAISSKANRKQPTGWRPMSAMHLRHDCARVADRQRDDFQLHDAPRARSTSAPITMHPRCDGMPSRALAPARGARPRSWPGVHSDVPHSRGMRRSCRRWALAARLPRAV